MIHACRSFVLERCWHLHCHFPFVVFDPKTLVPQTHQLFVEQGWLPTKMERGLRPLIFTLGDGTICVKPHLRFDLSA